MDEAVSDDSKEKKKGKKKKKIAENDVSNEEQISLGGRKRLSLREIAKLQVRDLHTKIFTFDAKLTGEDMQAIL